MRTLSIAELRCKLRRKAYIKQLLLDAITALIGAILVVLPFCFYYLDLL